MADDHEPAYSRELWDRSERPELTNRVLVPELDHHLAKQRLVGELRARARREVLGAACPRSRESADVLQAPLGHRLLERLDRLALAGEESLDHLAADCMLATLLEQDIGEHALELDIVGRCRELGR